MSDVHRAVEQEDLHALRDLLDDGADVHEELDGVSLLHHAVDVEVDGQRQTGEALHVDVTAYLLARGADPTRPSQGGRGPSAEQVALVEGHWLATELFRAWRRGWVGPRT